MAQITKELQFLEDFIDAIKLEDLSKLTVENVLEDIREQIQEMKAANEPVQIKDTANLKVYRCPACGQDYKLYKTFFTTIQVKLLKKIFAYCVQNKTHEIQKKDLPSLSRTEYGNFYTLQRFGMIYFLKDENGKRIKGGSWGIPLKRVAAFLQGEGKVAKYYLRNTATKQNTSSDEKVSIHEVKQINKFLDELKNFTPTFIEYETWQNTLDSNK